MAKFAGQGRWSRYCKFERDLSYTRSPRIRSILDPEEEFRPFAAPSHRVSKFIRLLNASEEIFGSIVGRLSRKLFPSSSAIFSFFFPFGIRQEDTRNISLCANSTYESIRLINSFSENTERFGRFEKRAGTYENWRGRERERERSTLRRIIWIFPERNNSKLNSPEFHERFD